MPVCRKWDTLNIFDSEYADLCETLDNAVTLYPEQPPFKQLIECIEWYNRQITEEKG